MTTLANRTGPSHIGSVSRRALKVGPSSARRLAQARTIHGTSLHLDNASTSPSEQPHHDLASFLKYATRTSLSPTTTLYVGTHYEYTVQASLQRLGLALTRTGGRLDKGIDLLGTWSLPTLPSEYPLRVLVQCKALKKKPGPSVVRELEGAFVGAPANWRASSVISTSRSDFLNHVDATEQPDVQMGYVSDRRKHTSALALLTSPLPATKGVREALARSRRPLAFALITLSGRVEQMLWNRSAAVDCGLEGMEVSVRYQSRTAEADEATADGEGAEPKSEAVLTYKGELWDFSAIAPQDFDRPGKNREAVG